MQIFKASQNFRIRSTKRKRENDTAPHWAPGATAEDPAASAVPHSRRVSGSASATRGIVVQAKRSALKKKKAKASKKVLKKNTKCIQMFKGCCFGGFEVFEGFQEASPLLAPIPWT